MDLKISKNESWAIAYINRDFIYRVERDLSKFKKYKDIVAYIPTVRILRKQFKGRDIFEEVPLLFNYGFFKIPNKLITIEFLQKMKEDIPAIYAWVKDAKTTLSDKPTLISGKEVPMELNTNPVALATSGEIQRLVSAHKEFSLYDKNDVEGLKANTIITLKGYPFDGMQARVRKINKKKEEIEVELLLEEIIKTAVVSFDNVFYTIYHGLHDEDKFKEKSLEEMALKNKNQY